MQISGLSASNTFSATDVLAIEVNVNGTNKTYKLTGATLAAALASIGSYLKTTDVVNNLTSTDPTKALAAPQGKALNDKMQAQTIQGAFTITDTDTEYNVSDMSTASLLIFQAMRNVTYRGSFVIPYSLFKDGRDCYFPFYASNIMGFVYVKYVSDTKIRVFTTDAIINFLSIQGIG